MNLTLQSPTCYSSRSLRRRADWRLGTRSAARSAYLRLLGIAFPLFSSVRVIAYLPTIWAIHQTGDASQHSIWTWLTWAGANMTMAAWMYEENGQRISRAVVVSLCNTGMCTATTALIAFHRWF